MKNFKFRANRVLPGVEDDSVSFNIKLPKLLLFEFRATGQYRNFSQWLSWEKIFIHGNISLKNKKGNINFTDKEAIIANCPAAANGLLFRLVVCPKNLGNIVWLSILSRALGINFTSGAGIRASKPLMSTIRFTSQR